MITLRKSSERGHADHGWLKSQHSFSFADYVDADHMGFRALRVINEDRVAPGMGFGEHGHRDMEIVSWVLDGALEHRDSMGHGAVLRPGELQAMSAGTGVRHSEFNASTTDPVHFLQIWIRPDRAGLQPGYAQKAFPIEERTNRLRVVASPDGRDGSVRIHQDVVLSTAVLEPGVTIACDLDPGRHAWVQVARGRLSLDGHPLEAGDGVAISGRTSVSLTGVERAEVLAFDLA